MAVNADTAEQLNTVTDLEAIADTCSDTELDAARSEDADQHEPGAPESRVGVRWKSLWRSPIRLAITVGIGMTLAVASLAGWLGVSASRHQTSDNARHLFIEVAKQGAVNLTTVSYTEVDKDVQRILESSTGVFHDDFQHRSQPFIDVVKQVRSTSTGTVTEAGLESEDGDQAQVLVAVEVKTATNGAAPPQQPRNWRMRITVQKVDAGVKVSNVQFVP